MLPLFAQEPVGDTLQLKGIEVTSKKVSRAAISANPVQIRGTTQIEAVAGISVAEAVKTFTGVNLRDYGGTGGLKTVMIRSLGANHTGVFVDGIPFSDMASGQIDLGKLPLEGLEEISLGIGTSGNQLLPARAYAPAGIINLKSIQPVFENRKSHGNFKLKTGSFGLINPSAGFSYKTGKKSWIDVSASWLKSKGDYPYLVDNGTAGRQTLKRKNSDIYAISTHTQYFLRLNDSTSFHARLRWYDAERGLPGAVVFYNPQSAQRLTNKDLILNIQYQSKIKNTTLLSNASWSRARLHYVDPYYLGQEKQLDNRYLQNEFYVSQAGSFKPAKAFSLNTAVDAIVNSFHSNLYDNKNPLRLSLLMSGSLHYQSKNVESSAGFLFSLIRDQNDSGYQKDLAKFDPFASLSVRLLNDPSLRFRMMYKESFRMPAFNELYYNIVGNINLKPENVNQLNAGWLFSFFKSKYFSLNGSADFFINHVNNKIIAIPTQNLFVWSMRNIGKVETKGFELQLEQHTGITKHLNIDLILNYTRQQAWDMTNRNSTAYRQQIPYIPLETFSASATVQYKDFTVSYHSLFNGFRYISTENTAENMLPGWWVSDLGLSWAYKTSRLKYQIKAQAVNLFDEQYVVIKSFPMPGRSYTLTFGLNF
ncbi:TonB-dependent receptor [Lentimicrobium sp.]